MTTSGYAHNPASQEIYQGRSLVLEGKESLGEVHDLAKCRGVGRLVVHGLVQGIACEFVIN